MQVLDHQEYFPPEGSLEAAYLDDKRSFADIPEADYQPISHLISSSTDSLWVRINTNYLLEKEYRLTLFNDQFRKANLFLPQGDGEPIKRVWGKDYRLEEMQIISDDAVLQFNKRDFVGDYVYLYLEYPKGVIATLEIQPTETLTEVTRVFWGALYGILFTIFLSATILFFFIGDRSFFYYSNLIGSYIFIAMAYTSQGYVFVWPEWPQFEEYSISIFGAWYWISLLLFARCFLRTNEHSPRLDRFMQFMIGPNAVIIFFSLIAVFATSNQYALYDGPTSISIIISLMIFNGILVVISAVTSYLKGPDKLSAAYFTAGWSIYIGGMMIVVMLYYGLVPRNDLTRHGIEIGQLIETCIVAMLLVRRLYQIRNEKERVLIEKTREEALRYAEIGTARSQYDVILGKVLNIANKLNEQCYSVADSSKNSLNTQEYLVQFRQSLLKVLKETPYSANDYSVNELVYKLKTFLLHHYQNEGVLTEARDNVEPTVDSDVVTAEFSRIIELLSCVAKPFDTKNKVLIEIDVMRASRSNIGFTVCLTQRADLNDLAVNATKNWINQYCNDYYSQAPLPGVLKAQLNYSDGFQHEGGENRFVYKMEELSNIRFLCTELGAKVTIENVFGRLRIAIIWQLFRYDKRNGEEQADTHKTLVYYLSTTTQSFDSQNNRLQIRCVQSATTIISKKYMSPLIVFVEIDQEKVWMETVKELRTRCADIAIIATDVHHILEKDDEVHFDGVVVGKVTVGKIYNKVLEVSQGMAQTTNLISQLVQTGS